MKDNYYRPILQMRASLRELEKIKPLKSVWLSG